MEYMGEGNSVLDEQINVERIEVINEVNNNKYIYELIKRIFDIVFAVIALPIALIISIIACIAVVIESKGMPIYTQERVGIKGNKFLIYKIRSMYVDAEKDGAQWASKDDARITKVGAIIRKTRIDELPQLFNLLKGDMTLIGPRPERAIFIEQFEKEIPGFKERLLVKPGLTGLAQVSGGYELEAKEKLKFDLEYIRDRNILLDIKILLKTVKVVVTGDGAR